MFDPGTLTLLAAMISCLISVISLIRSGNKSHSNEGETQGRMLAMLDQLCDDVKELNRQQKEISNFNSQADERFRTLYSEVHTLKQEHKDIRERVAAIERK